MILDGELKPRKPNTLEECGGYYKRHIKLRTILGSSTSSGCWWFILPPIWNLDKVLNTYF